MQLNLRVMDMRCNVLHDFSTQNGDVVLWMGRMCNM